MMTSDDLKERIEAIETGYEFMLAYAAQGRQTDKGAAAGRNVREYLDKMVAALERLAQNHGQSTLPKQVAAFGISGGDGGGLKRLLMSHPPLDESCPHRQPRSFASERTRRAPLRWKSCSSSSG